VFERRSPLARQLARGGRDGLDGRRALLVGEVRDWALAQLAVFPGREAEMAAAVGPLLGAAALAARAGAVQRTATACVYRTAPDACWVVAREPTVISSLLAAVPASVGTVTSLSHSRVRLRVEGPAARTVLACGISVDLHPHSFAVGAFAQTGLHHAGVLLERCAPQRYELYVLRTFALSVGEWLLDAGAPGGYEIAVESAAAAMEN
jgi:heterotetrameric sarcosine oxidase gamma subunit